MVILPTEKSFDWQHTPVVLIAVTLLNVFVFFFYQSGDSEKLDTAYSLYEEADLFSIEWPLYQSYLQQQGNLDTLEEWQGHVDDGYGGQIAYFMLTDTGFTHYLQENYRDVVPDNQYNQWSSARPMVNHLLESLSFYRFALIPNQLSVMDLFTYQFLHGDTMHLLGNLFFLVVCGFAVEAAIGHLRFLGFYLVTGVVAGLSHSLFDLDSGTSLVGASGSISGVMAMYLGVFRLRKIEFFYWFFVFVGYFRAPALLLLPIYVGKEIFDFFSSDGSNVAYLAHAGGFVAGGLMIFVSLWINPQSVDEEYIETDQSNNEYQEKLAKVYKAIENFQFAAALRNLEGMIQEFGIDFHLATLRYNLTKIKKPEEFPQWTQELLALRPRNAHEMENLQKVWNENPDLVATLDDETALNMGMRFSTKEQFSTAESIFKTLYNKTPRHPQLTLLAHKLSEVAKQVNEPKKYKSYLQFAKSDQPSSQGMHG